MEDLTIPKGPTCHTRAYQPFWPRKQARFTELKWIAARARDINQYHSNICGMPPKKQVQLQVSIESKKNIYLFPYSQQTIETQEEFQELLSKGGLAG